MKRFSIFLLITIAVAHSYQTHCMSELPEQQEVTNQDSYDGYFKEFDFDSMADEMTQVGYQVTVKPPSTFMYWVRRIGTPIFLKYLNMVEFLKKKYAKAKEYRERWAKTVATYIQVQRRLPGQPRGSRGIGLGRDKDGVKVYIS